MELREDDLFTLASSLSELLGAPVTIERLLGLVKLGMTQSATSAVPSASHRFIVGMLPLDTACAM